MGRRKRNDDSNLKQGICKGATLREENIGKKEVDVSSVLKIKHLQKLATWAAGEGGIPSLGALFGYQLAANAEASGVPLDKSSFFCQRCESILQPGFNCTVRIETCKKKKRKRSKKASTSFQNNIIYNCNFCHHRNSIKGTPKGHVKNLISLRESRLLQCSLNEAATEEVQANDRDPISQLNCFSSSTNDSVAGDFSDQKAPVTPLQKCAILSKSKRELESRMLLGSSNSAELSGSSKGSSRKKRKIWSSLKNIVERKEAETTQNGSNFTFPLFMQEK